MFSAALLTDGFLSNHYQALGWADYLELYRCRCRGLHHRWFKLETMATTFVANYCNFTRKLTCPQRKLELIAKKLLTYDSSDPTLSPEAFRNICFSITPKPQFELAGDLPLSIRCSADVPKDK
jgi:hypothetical protein